MDNTVVKRINCWKDTLHKSKNLSLHSPSVKIKYDNNLVKNYNKKYENSNINFYDMDAIDCCLLHAPNALVLNLADENYPGGSVDVGSGAQEEALFRRTNYCSSLNVELYPIRNDEVIYSPGISVIKTNEQTEWDLLDINNLPKISFIACPGIAYPETIIVNDEKKLNKTDVKILKMKIVTIIQTAIKFNHDTIIFGALGCGAWRNPVKHIAQIFKQILHIYDGCVLNFYFAILSTPNKNKIVGEKNVDIFKNVFN
jgi:uncharacterized protein (TIGR02452 family)